MNRKDLVQEIALRLKKMRGYIGRSGPRMANSLGIQKSSYYRNELGKTSPDLWSYHLLGVNFDVNLNWLICGKGEIFLEKETGSKKSRAIGDLEPEMIEMIQHMQKIPSLRHELLARYHHFKDEHPEIVAKKMNG